MPRVIWKGAISFGLVHVPVSLLPASAESGLDFDWLDKRTMDPVGYKRINKRSGEEVHSDDIVRGVKVETGSYVVLGDDEIKAAYPKTTQTIEIEAFVAPSEIAFTLLEKPYYLEPLARGERVYALLREAMNAAGVVGIARLVLHSKEHLAAVVPVGAALMLDTLRWAGEVRGTDSLKLPPAGRAAAGLKDAEMKMAAQLIQDMTVAWKPEAYADRFTQALRALIDERAAAGKTTAVRTLEGEDKAATSNVVDLTELLRLSLGNRKAAAPRKAAPKTRRV